MILNTSARTENQIQKLLLIVSKPGLRDEIERFLPSADVIEEEHLLTGLLRMSRESFDVVVIQVPRHGDELSSALKSFKRVNRSVRIILMAEMLDEPIALDLTQRGLADEYLILPLYTSELDVTLKRLAPSPAPFAREASIILPQYPQFKSLPGGEMECMDAQQAIVRELSELIAASHRGLQNLLERVCWSAVFLFRVAGAKMSVGEDVVCVGKEPSQYGHTIPLIEDGKEIGKLELATEGGEVANLCFAEYLEQLVPGLIRMASSHGELQELASTDPLTGLANRRHLMETLDALIERARNERFRITLVLFDFDNFKHYNDTFGHGAGDEILREAGMLIKQCIRRQDLAARFGGDEIAVVLWDWQQRRMPNSEHPRSAMAIMERFRKLLKSHYFTRLGPQMQGALTISGGLASFPWDANDAEELIERADGALLEAKRSGKDRLYLVGQAAEKTSD
jgi:diguanylate cyclase (GGDEF)-like protein